MTRPLFLKHLSAPRPDLAALAIALTAIAAVAFRLHDGGFAVRAWPLAAGVLFGIALQRGELSLVRAWRDLVTLRDADQLIGLTFGLAVAATLTLAGVVIEGEGFVTPAARIGPVSWVLPFAAFTFGVGSVIARGSLMVHLRRLGEGSLVAVPALLATFVGFVIAMACWPWVWAHAVARAPSPWLPDWIGAGPTLGLELSALGACALVFFPRRRRFSGNRYGAFVRATVAPWRAWAAAGVVGIVAAASYWVGEPLGLTGECAAVARYVATALGLASAAMPGLDQGVGGLLIPLRAPSFSGHLVIVTGVLAGSFAAALASGRFSIAGMSAREAAEMALGGLFIGFGGMIGLGTVTGAAVSGIAIGAVSGWVFLVFASLGIVAALKLDPRPAVIAPPPEPTDAPEDR